MIAVTAAEKRVSSTAAGAIGQSGRFLLYSHDGLGLGHMRRNLSVARALAKLAPHASILLATSAEEAQRFDLPRNVDVLRLPGLRKIDNGSYAALRLNVAWRDVRSVRETLLFAAANAFRPSVLLADKHPLGLDGELEPALAETRAAGGKAALGLRDVLDDPAVVRVELEDPGIFDRIPEYYDRVLVYGQPDVLDALREYAFPPEVAAITRYCGYVVSPPGAGRETEDGLPALPEFHRHPLVLATAGGGEDGFDLLSTFIDAAASSRWEGVVVSGPHCEPSRVRRLRRLAEDGGVAFRRFVPGLYSEFREFDALVCMGGYNTLAEAVASGVPILCVPRSRPRSEQLIRGRAFAGRGLLRLLEPERLDAEALKSEIDLALSQAGRSGASGIQPLDMGGAECAARHLLELAAASKPVETAAVVRAR